VRSAPGLGRVKTLSGDQRPAPAVPGPPQNADIALIVVVFGLAPKPERLCRRLQETRWNSHLSCLVAVRRKIGNLEMTPRN
jgi:hypothetical protein